MFKIKIDDQCSILWLASLLKDGFKKNKIIQTNTVIVKCDILNRENKRGTTLFLSQKSSYLCLLFITNAQTNE